MDNVKRVAHLPLSDDGGALREALDLLARVLEARTRNPLGSELPSPTQCLNEGKPVSWMPGGPSLSLALKIAASWVARGSSSDGSFLPNLLLRILLTTLPVAEQKNEPGPEPLGNRAWSHTSFCAQ